MTLREGLLQEIEDVQQAVREEVLYQITVLRADLGLGAFRLHEGTPDEQLEQWIHVRSDVAYHAQALTDLTARYGRPAAERMYAVEMDRLERLLLKRGEWNEEPDDLLPALRRGVEAVARTAALKASRQAEKVMEKAERTLEKPPIMAIPDVPVPDDLALIGGLPSDLLDGGVMG